jgi:hypothetical protein
VTTPCRGSKGPLNLLVDSTGIKAAGEGEWRMARDFDRQVAELRVHVAVLNGDTALGIPVTEPVG